MKSIYWDLSGFNLFFNGDHKNLYQVEAQIDSLIENIIKFIQLVKSTFYDIDN